MTRGSGRGKSVTLSWLLFSSDNSTLARPLRSVELGKEWKRVRNRENLRHYPDFFRLFYPPTPLRSVELSKEWKEFHDWGIKVRYCPDLVRLFHTFIPLRSAELITELHGVRDWGKVWQYRFPLCQTIHYFHAF